MLINVPAKKFLLCGWRYIPVSMSQNNLQEYTAITAQRWSARNIRTRPYIVRLNNELTALVMYQNGKKSTDYIFLNCIQLSYQCSGSSR